MYRHLICEPYSTENLHKMAIDLNIKKCWYHGGLFPHYDIPKRRVKEITDKCELISIRALHEKIKANHKNKLTDN